MHIEEVLVKPLLTEKSSISNRRQKIDILQSSKESEQVSN